MKRILSAAAILFLITACDQPQNAPPANAIAESKPMPTAAPAPAPVPPMEAKAEPLTGPMSFFVTSVGAGDGANFGGIEGADEHCQDLASDVGAGDKTWRAYLSTSGRIDQKNPEYNSPSVHARDRIGTGPWFNAKGELIAKDVEQLHSNNNISKQTALSEKGTLINGRGDTPNEHDILTGSRMDGTVAAPLPDSTCKNWTSNDEGSAVVGHHDLVGLAPDNWAKSWNFAHHTRGCSQDALKSSGGAGLLYCFAID